MEIVCVADKSKYLDLTILFPNSNVLMALLLRWLNSSICFKIRLLLPNKFASSENKTRSITVVVYCLECVNTRLCKNMRKMGICGNIYSRWQVVITYIWGERVLGKAVRVRHPNVCANWLIPVFFVHNMCLFVVVVLPFGIRGSLPLVSWWPYLNVFLPLTLMPMTAEMKWKITWKGATFHKIKILN